MSDYALGMSMGLVLGMVIFMPGGNEMTVKLDRDDAKALKSGAEISAALKQRTCSRIQQAVQDFRDNKTDVIILCPEDLHRNAPAKQPRPSPGLHP